MIAITFTGARAFLDRTALRFLWQPGDTKLVTPKAAQTLLRYAEFSRAESEPDAGSREALLLRQAEVDAEIDAEDSVTDGVLLSVAGWDRDQLNAYAKRYSTKLDNRKTVENLRLEVSGLVEQFGVM